ncbi:MAG: hypothetical protein ACOX37_07690 [Bacillota bacterium]
MSGPDRGIRWTKKSLSTAHKIIRVDIDPAELTNQLDIDVGIVGDAKNVLRQLTDAIEKTEYPEWVEFIQMMNENMMIVICSHGFFPG